MARKHEAARLLQQGLPPSAIAAQMHTSTAAILQYLALMVGEGELRRSDIAFALPRELRMAIEGAIESTGSHSSTRVTRELASRGTEANRHDVAIYLTYRRSRVVLGDMYELVRNVEVRLHRFIKQAFLSEYGEENWWRSGVPDTIRAECAALLEKDPEPASEPYCYTHLISLREILEKRWAVLMRYMPKNFSNQKKDIMERLIRLNRIRNGVMHPVRNAVITEEEFEFVRELEHSLSGLEVQPLPAHEQAPPLVDTSAAGENGGNELVAKLAPTKDERTVREEAATAEQANEKDAAA